MKTLTFHKYTGIGNDFIIVDMINNNHNLRDFYSDRDITAEDSLRFTLRIKPFTSLSAPAYKGF